MIVRKQGTMRRLAANVDYRGFSLETRCAQRHSRAMSEKPQKSGKNWAGAAAIAGAAIGSAALAAALLYVSRRKPRPTDPPARPHHAPETD